MGKKVLHRGIVKVDERLVVYYSDNVDSLPPNLQNYERMEIPDFSWSAFFQEVTRGEAEKDFWYNIQIGDLFYETLPKE